MLDRRSEHAEWLTCGGRCRKAAVGEERYRKWREKQERDRPEGWLKVGRGLLGRPVPLRSIVECAIVRTHRAGGSLRMDTSEGAGISIAASAARRPPRRAPRQRRSPPTHGASPSHVV